MSHFREPFYSEPDSSFTTLDYTFSDSKYSCVSWMYPVHITFAYLVGISGLLALLSRVIPKLTPYHPTFGRWYIIFMLWCMASSLLIYNTGLPFPIIVSFVYLLVSITLGWNAIKVHTSRITAAVTQKVNEKINNMMFRRNHTNEIDLEQITLKARTDILSTKTFSERIFSFRMLHGILMTFSWSQMVGRTFVTNPFKSFHGCWTYPAYKSMILNSPVYPVDGVSNPPFPMKNGVFIAMITAPTLVIILLVALIVTYCYYRSDSKGKSNEISPNASFAINQ